MKNKKLALLSLGLVAAVAGVATSSALLYQEAQQTASGKLDAGIILKWGETNATSFTDLDSLSYGTPEFREVTVGAPTKSEGLTGYVKVTFTMTTNDGLVVEIAEETWQTETVAVRTLDATGETYTSYIDLATFEVEKTYYVRLSLSHAPEEGQEALEGTLSVSLDYSETNA